MTKKKNAPDDQISLLRTPKPKQKLGLRVPQIQMPHLELVHPEVKPDEVKSEPDTKVNSNKSTTLSTQSRQTSQGRQTSQTNFLSQSTLETPVAPTRDFQKVPNSITKSAIPDGFFKPGKSKILYDVLYSLTRGDIEPKRSIRISKTKLMKLATIGSRITFDSIVSQFESTGLVKVTVYAGEHEGNEFEVFTPDEIKNQTTLPSMTRQSSHTSMTSHAQNLDRVVSLDSRQTSQSLNVENKTSSTEPKTLLKTLKYIDDDAPIMNVLEKLNEMARKLTGKDLTKKDLEKLSDLVELMISETVFAAARTDSVSSTIAFMTENLRRRLYSKPRASTGKLAKKDIRPTHLDVGKRTESAKEEEDTSLIWTPQTPLTEEQRENTLNALKEAKSENSILYREFKTYGEIEYAPEDFEWLLKNLEKQSD